MKRSGHWILLLMLGSIPGHADEDTAAEVDYLLTSVGNSQCIFIRNDDEHEASKAEDHLRMKYRRGKKWVKNTEHFIDRIATKSSWTSKPYLIRCPGREQLPTALWFKEKLTDYRNSQ